MPILRGVSVQYTQMSHHVTIHDGIHVLELQGGDVTGEAGDDAGHLPRAQGESARPHGASLCEAIVLAQSSNWGGGGKR